MITAAGRAPTKNTAVEPTTSTPDGTSSRSCTDEENGYRTNQTEEKAHREGRYTHTNIAEDP